MIINLVVGDWSADGHEKTDTFSVEVNKIPFSPPRWGDVSSDTEESIFYQGCVKLGLSPSFTDEVCAGYDDPLIPKDLIYKVYGEDESDLPEEEILIEEDSEGHTIYFCTPKGWAFLLLDICKIGDPNFEYEFTNNPTFNLRGHGLYY